MSRLRNFILTSVMAGALTATAASAAVPDDARLAQLRGALAELNEGNGLSFEIGNIEMLAPMTGFARVHRGRIEVSPIALDLFRNREEARALAAFLVVYVAPPPAVAPRGPGVAENVAAAGAVLAGMALDPGKPRRELDLDWQDLPARSGPQAGARILSMLEKAHGCSAPLVAVLARASLAKERDPATAQLVYLARKASRDLGKTVYPPDNRCVGGA
ncbi:MAG TPA: hypothetical protein VGE65_07965 [Sphingobium sp.]